jgi:hypothetical protein
MDTEFVNQASKNCIYNKLPLKTQPHALPLLTNNASPQAFLVRLGLRGRGGLGGRMI